jgi:dipeptidase E
LLRVVDIGLKVLNTESGADTKQRIVAIGGGETMAETTPINVEIVRLSDKPNPKLLFIPTASGDSRSYYQSVSEHFLSLGCESVEPLYLLDDDMTAEQARDAVLQCDVVYVGGGNTLRMMNIWRRYNLPEVFDEARQRGIVLSGLSAGSICWFRYGNSDAHKFTSGSNKLIKVSGLGYIEALHCPHYDIEVHRQADLERMMRQTPRLVAVALDNGVAIEVVDEQYRIITNGGGGKARRAYWYRGAYVLEEIPADDAWRPLRPFFSKSHRLARA